MNYTHTRLRTAHYNSYSLFDGSFTWITVVILELIHAKVPGFTVGEHLLDVAPNGRKVLLRTHNNSRQIDRKVGVSFKFLTYQLVSSVLDY